MRSTFDLWYDFYKRSETTMEFKVFCDHSCPWTCIGDVPLIRLNSNPPCDINNLSYGDWMRSDLYKTVQQPLIYMDMDCLILEPIDDTYFNFDAKFGMSYGSLIEKDFNSGLIVFKDDVSFEYQHLFNNNPQGYPRESSVYGQAIWSDLNKEIGHVIPTEHHCTWHMVRENNHPDNIKVLHLHGQTSATFLRMARILKEKV